MKDESAEEEVASGTEAGPKKGRAVEVTVEDADLTARPQIERAD